MEQIIVGTGTQTPISWPGGSGTVVVSEIQSAENLPIDTATNTGTNPGSVGDWNGCSITFEASFNGGNLYKSMMDSGAVVTFAEGVLEAKNFSSAECLIRANIAGATSGIGLLMQINPR